MIAGLKTTGKSAEEILSLLQEALAQWLPTQEATRIDLVASGLGYAGWLGPVLTAPEGTRTRIRDPFAISSAAGNLRRTMAEPGRGAWIWAHQWITTDELVLHTDYDWMRRPWFTNSNDPDGYSPPHRLRLRRRTRSVPPRFRTHPAWLAQGAERARTTPPDENEGVHQAIAEQEHDARRNS